MARSSAAISVQTRKVDNSARLQHENLEARNALLRETHRTVSLYNSVLCSRVDYIAKMMGDTKRDIDKECLYPTKPYTIDTYELLYRYYGVAKRVVDVYPKETWRAKNIIYDTVKNQKTAFEKRIDELMSNSRLKINYNLSKADELSRVYTYGGLILGLSDVNKDTGKTLADPVSDYNDLTGRFEKPSKPLDLIFLRPFRAYNCRVKTYHTDENSPLYGSPEMYTVSTQPPNGNGELASNTPMIDYDVHFSRVIHIVDNPSGYQWESPPCMESVIPYIYDIRKVSSGAPEMFWQGAFPGLSIEALPELITQGFNPKMLDEASLKDQISKYRLGLQKYIALVGSKANSLAPNISSPEPFISMSLDLLCASIDVPTKIFLGSQMGQVAGEEDTKRWRNTIASRRTEITSPNIVRPFWDRMIDFRVVPEPRNEYIDEWILPNESKSKDVSDAILKQAQSLSQYAGSNAPSVMGPLCFMTDVMGLSEEIAQKALTEAKATKKSILPPVPKPQKAGGLRKGTSPGRNKGK